MPRAHRKFIFKVYDDHVIPMTIAIVLIVAGLSLMTQYNPLFTWGITLVSFGVGIMLLLSMSWWCRSLQEREKRHSKEIWDTEEPTW
ncbi:MAG: hypothetical protein ACFFD6_06665 [Candidatus Thorarchaeota archaeon]